MATRKKRYNQVWQLVHKYQGYSYVDWPICSCVHLKSQQDTRIPVGHRIQHTNWSQDFTKKIILLKYFTSFVLITPFSILLCRPAYGGKFCEGSSRSYKLCNTEDCPPNTSDYRAQQCAEFNSKQFRGWYYTWSPYTRVDGKTIVALKQGYPKCCLWISK